MIQVCSILVLLSGISISFSPSIQVFIFLRAIVAASTTSLFSCGFVYCMEHVGGKWSTLVSFALEYSWACGYLVVPLVAWLIPRWNQLQLALSLPTLIFVGLMLLPSLIPESPKWLLANKKHEQTEKILRTAEKVNTKRGKEETMMKNLNKTDVVKDVASGSSSVLDLFRHASLARCTLIMYYLWFTNNLVYYGLTFNAGKLIPGDVYVNMVISGFLEFAAYTCAIFSFLYIGRR